NHRRASVQTQSIWRISGRPAQEGQMFMFGTYEGFQQRLARSSASIVPGTFARQGLLPNGSPVPDLKPQMLKYANAFWPAPSTPDRPDEPPLLTRIRGRRSGKILVSRVLTTSSPAPIRSR